MWIGFTEDTIPLQQNRMEKTQIELGFSKAHLSYATEALAQQHMVYRLMKMWPQDCPFSGVKHLLEIGCGSGFLTRELAATFAPERATINDLSPAWEAHVRPFFASDRWTFLAADAEEHPWEESYDLIASSACLQWFTDPLRFLSGMMERLLPSGILLFSSFGPDNLKEIRALTGQGLDYPPIGTLMEPLQQHHRLELKINDPIQLRFKQPVDVLRHLKRTGVNRSNAQFWTPGRLAEFSTEYARFQLEDGTYPLTYDPFYFCVRK